MILTLNTKKREADNGWSFIFEPSEQINWQAGQFMRFQLGHENVDQKGDQRWFTISSAPYEGFIQLTTRISNSTFKKALSRLEPGHKIKADSLDGDFIWRDRQLPTVFIVGGIGITPYHSILKQRIHEGKPLPLTLIYGNRTQNIIFKEPFDRWDKERDELKVLYRTGDMLNLQVLARSISDLYKHFIYLSGPEPMVDTLGKKLIESGLPENQLKQDWFPGYTENNY